MHVASIELRYPFDATQFYYFANSGYCSFDADGVPIIDYDRVFKAFRLAGKERFGLQYNITAVCQYGLGALSLYLLENEPQYKEQFLQQAKWLLHSVVLVDGVSGFWYYKFPFPSYGLKPPFTSGMAQGQGLSMLLRAYQLTGETSYLDAAHIVFASFRINVEQGGFRTVDVDGKPWFEEYPSSPPSYVLNGYVFAIVGLYEYAVVTKSEAAWVLWQQSIEILKSALPLYDRGFWSCYDRFPGRVATVDYHKIHIEQMHTLADLTGDAIFRDFEQRWKKNLNSRLCRFRAAIIRISLRRKLATVWRLLPEMLKSFLR